jgi:hypothetical protein
VRRWEDEKVRRWEDEKVRRWEGEKVGRWEGQRSKESAERLWNSEGGMRPPARRGHRGLRPGGKAEKKEGERLGRWEGDSKQW